MVHFGGAGSVHGASAASGNEDVCALGAVKTQERERVGVLRGPPLTLGSAHINVPVTCFFFFRSVE